ncbi:MAG: TetR/AcrR family transcriptional regulator [Clostridiales bacterium]|nr:TetR/AcrR family transcriptional regulator [Clostridiales bacterium]
MPPKSKFTREEIVSTALDEVEKNGFDALTARTLAAALGSSPRPIFTVFSSMDEVCAAVVERANALYNSYVDEGLRNAVPFRGVGEAYLRFAHEHPKLFMLLFMREQTELLDERGVLDAIDQNAEKILQSVMDYYGLERQKAERLYMHLWVYTHGIAAAVVTGVCKFSDEKAMLTEQFVAVLKHIKQNED